MEQRAARISALVGAAGLVALAGCSGSSGGSGGTPSGSPSTSATATTAAAACVTQAQQIVDQFKQTIKMALPSATLDASAAAGKKVWLVSISQATQFTQQLGQGFKQAASAAGVAGTLFDGQFSVPKWNEGIADATAANAAVLDLHAIAPAVVSGTLKQAQSKGVKVILDTVDEPATHPAGIAALLGSSYEEFGHVQAAYTLAQSQCDPSASKALALVPAALGTTPPWIKGIKETYASLCAQCQVSFYQFPVTDIGNLGQLVVPKLRAASDTRWLIGQDDNFVNPVMPAMKQGGISNVKVVGGSGYPQNLTLLANHDPVFVADIMNVPQKYLGWLIVDDAMRLILGKQTSDPHLPVQLVDASSGIDPKNPQPDFGDYPTAFKQLWGK
jgi:ribose transport system substrate-binding protein